MIPVTIPKEQTQYISYAMLDQMKTKGIAWPRFDGAGNGEPDCLSERPERGGSEMADQQKQPVIVLLTSHWITMAGVALVTLAGFSWLFVLPANIRGHVGNPYIGLLVFIAIPIVFFAGLALIPIGIALGRRRAATGFGAALDRQSRVAARWHFFRDHDGCEPRHRKPVDLSRRRAHGNRPVLRTELPRHEARVHGPSPPAASSK